MPDMKLQDMKLTDQVTGREIAGHEIEGHENTRPEFARHDEYRMQIDYITLEFAFFFILNLLYVRRVC